MARDDVKHWIARNTFSVDGISYEADFSDYVRCGTHTSFFDLKEDELDERFWYGDAMHWDPHIRWRLTEDA